MRRSPNFLIVGAAKSGTTILHEWLAMQTDVFVPVVKEPHYFCFDGMDAHSIGSHVDPHYAAQMAFDSLAYERLYTEAAPDQMTGEASPGYLYFPGVASAIHAHNADTKIICMLRNPAERAFSQFMHHVRDGYEPLRDFGEALAVEEARIKEKYWWGYHYRRGGFYAQRLQEYFDHFSPEQIKVILFEDLADQPRRVLQETADFLGITCNNWPDPRKQTNVASRMQRVARFHWQAKIAGQHRGMARLMKKFALQPTGRICGMAAPKFDKGLRRKMLEEYRADIEKTGELIGKDLSHWVTGRTRVLNPPGLKLMSA